MSDDKISFVLDLENKDFLEKTKEAQTEISKISDTKNFNLLKDSLSQVTSALGLVASVAGAVKVSFDALMIADEVKAVNHQFKVLSSNIGIAASELKEKLIGASGGLADDEEILKAANRALVEMGHSASKFPEIMEVARKATALFGGELTQNFENIAHAIASGQERALKQYGLLIDQKKAYEDYAKKIGVAVSALSEQEKQQAFLNATLERAKEAFAGVNLDITENRNTWEKLKVTLGNTLEAAAIAFEKIAGKPVRSVLDTFNDFANYIKNKFESDIEDGLDGAKAAVEEYAGLYARKLAEIEELNKKKSLTGDPYVIAEYNRKLRAANEELAEYKKRLIEAQDAVAKFKSEEKTKPTTSKEDKEAIEKRKESEAKLYAELTKLQAERISMHQRAVTTITNIEAIEQEKRILLYKQNQDRINAIRKSEEISEAQKNKLIEEENKNLNMRLISLAQESYQAKINFYDEQIKKQSEIEQAQEFFEQKRFEIISFYREQENLIKSSSLIQEQERNSLLLELETSKNQALLDAQIQFEEQKKQVIENSVLYAQSAGDRFAEGFISGSKKAQLELSNFAKHGQQVFGMFTNHAANAFMKLGEGSKKGSEVMRQAMFGMIADVSQYYGTMMLAAGLFPPNPVALAGGAALLALAGFLRSKASGATAFDTGGVGGMGGGFEMGNIGQSAHQVQEQERKEKSFQLTIMGSYFETEQTKTRLLELMREASDATDFRYNRIGGGNT